MSNPFDLIDWTVIKYITFDINRCRIQGFSEIPIMSFDKEGKYWACSPTGHREVYGYVNECREHMEEEFPNLLNSLPVYYFDQFGTGKPMKLLSFEEPEIEHHTITHVDWGMDTLHVHEQYREFLTNNFIVK